MAMISVAAAKKAGAKVSRVPSRGGHHRRQARRRQGRCARRSGIPAGPVQGEEVGDNGDPFQTKLGAYYVIHVNGVTPPKIKPMDQVRAQALADWTEEQRSRLLAATAQAMAMQAAKDKSLDAISRELKLSVEHSPALTRGTDSAQFPAAIVAKLFNAPAGGVDFGPQGTSGNFVIARITGISQFIPGSTSTGSNFTNRVMRFLANHGARFCSLRSRQRRPAPASEGVKVNQAARLRHRREPVTIK